MQPRGAPQQLDRLRRGLREVRPGIDDQLLIGDAARARQLESLAEEAHDLGEHVAVEVGILEALLGGRARVHHDQRRPRLRADVGQLRIAQAADVVDDRRAGGDRRRRARPACRCRPRPAPPARRRRVRSAARRARSPRRPRQAGGWSMPDSPPTSITRAPAAISSRASVTRDSSVGWRPASEKLSGVALTIPISHGRSPNAWLLVRPRAGRRSRDRQVHAQHRAQVGAIGDRHSDGVAPGARVDVGRARLRWSRARRRSRATRCARRRAP